MGESQEDTSTEHDCQKCGKAIQQVPYKYEGWYFHARCLTCSTCGKKLAGKPFLTVENKIFCGEQCKEEYQEPISGADTTAALPTDTTQHSNTELTSNGLSETNESLLEALSVTDTSPSHPQHTLPEVTLTRITDYPGHTLSQTSPGSIRRSSLSISEGSLTGSLTSDGGSHAQDSISLSTSQPRKRILKKTHGLRKHKSSNRVRWNIPEEGAGDSLSLLSFESTSTASGVSSSSYRLAREAVNEARRNWREFEKAPPPGSTGLTPTKPSLTTLRETAGESDQSSMSLSPTLSSIQPAGQPSLVSPPTQLPRHGMGTSNMGTGHSTSSTYHSTHLGSSTPHQTSTPLRRHSDSSTTKEFHSANRLHPNSAQLSVAPPPILRLDHSNLSELEASTAEERVKCNLFEFPPTTVSSGGPRGPPTTEKIPIPPPYSGYIPPEGHAHLYGGSDADDYDHLSPQFSSAAAQTLSAANRSKNIRFDFFPRPSKTTCGKLSSSTSPPPPPPRSSSSLPSGGPPKEGIEGVKTHYGDSDIDEALNGLAESGSSRSSSADPQSPVPLLLSSPLAGKYLAPGGPLGSAAALVPPPIPPKLRRRKSESPTTNSRSPTLGKSEGQPSDSTHSVEDRSSEDGYEDALSSVSTATLVPSEPGDSVPTAGAHAAMQQNRIKPRPWSRARTECDGSAKSRTSARIHPEIVSPLSSSAPVRQSWGSQWTESGTTAKSFAPHPPPMMHHRQQQSSSHAHELPLPRIEEGLHLERQSVITVSNSGSDSSLRGTSPPEKITQTPVVMSSKFDRVDYTEDSLSQPLPTGVFPGGLGGQISGLYRGHSQNPRFRNPPALGGNGSAALPMSRNHRLYHSHRSGLAQPRPRHRGAGNFPLGSTRPPQSARGNPRAALKFQFSWDPPEVSNGSEEVSSLVRSHSPPFQSRALSQDDPPLVTGFYPAGGFRGGRGLLPRPRIQSSDGAICDRRSSQNGFHNSRKPFSFDSSETGVTQQRKSYPQGHTHRPRPLQGHTQQTQGHTQPQKLKAHSMTAV